MKWEDKDVLARFRGPGKCPYCKRFSRRLEAAHIYSKGAGQVDLAANIVGLCSVFSGGLDCHARSHNGGRPNRQDLLEIAAHREGLTPEIITDLVRDVRNLWKYSTEADVRAVEQASYQRAKELRATP